MIFEENEKIELKEIYISDIKKEVIAFVKAAGGTLYIGVADDGTVIMGLVAASRLTFTKIEWNLFHLVGLWQGFRLMLC